MHNKDPTANPNPPAMASKIDFPEANSTMNISTPHDNVDASFSLTSSSIFPPPSFSCFLDYLYKVQFINWKIPQTTITPNEVIIQTGILFPELHNIINTAMPNKGAVNMSHGCQHSSQSIQDSSSGLLCSSTFLRHFLHKFI